MSLFDLLLILVFFALLVFGPGWLIARHLPLDPAEKLVAAVACSLLTVWLLAWGVYVLALPGQLVWAWPALAALGIGAGGKEIARLGRDPGAREFLVGQVLASCWCVGCLAFVLTYSGGGWSGDWLEHWQRTLFFLERWPRDHVFLHQYVLPARPPLMNVLTGAWLELTARDFAHFQLFGTLVSSLVFLPAALLARRFAGHAGAATMLVPLLLLNPLFVQNATFAWTKLPAAFFALAAVAFFLRRRGPEGTPTDGLLVSGCLAAGMLAHFSVGPYAVLLIVAWVLSGWRDRAELRWWRETALAALVGAAGLATWFGWSVAHYGRHATFFSNTSITTADANAGSQLVRFALNLRDTIVPHFLRHPDQTLLQQTNAWGSLRDWFFQLYQLNLFFAFGSVAGFIIVRELVRLARTDALPSTTRASWGAMIVACLLLGVAVHGARDDWGLMHICLPTFVLLGLAFLAARWPGLTGPWRLALLGGLAIDALCGVALHLAVENYALDRWLPDGRPFDRVMLSYTAAGRYNIIAKAQEKLGFFADVFTAPPILTLAALALILGAALYHTRRVEPSAK